MISAVYIFSMKGELLLQRVYTPPGPPHLHLKALARSLIAERAFADFAPVLCVGSGSSISEESESAGNSSFTWFTPPRGGSGSVYSSFTSSPLALSAASSPAVTLNGGVGGAAAAAGQSSVYTRGSRQGATRRRYGGPSIDENGVVYVAALHRNGNVACALEVLRRLAALVQAFFTAAVQAGVSGGGTNMLSTTEQAFSAGGSSSLAQRGVSGGADAAGKRKASANAGGRNDAAAASDAKTSFSPSWGKMRRGVSVPPESTPGAKRKIRGDTDGVLMPAAAISPFVTCDNAYKAVGDGGGDSGGVGGCVTEMFIKKNFVLLHELLDEAVDGGYPQLLDLTALKQFIFLGSSRGVGSLLPAWAADLLGTRSRVGSSQLAAGGAPAFGSSSTSAGGGGGFGGLSLKPRNKSIGALQDVLQSRKITNQVTGACAWRPPGIKYRSNEVFVDVVECLNVLISQNGVILRADVTGQIVVNCKLSGMPECKFGLNDRFLATTTSSGSSDSSGSSSGTASAAAGGKGNNVTRRPSTPVQQQGRHLSSSSAVAAAKQAPKQPAVRSSGGGAGSGARGQKNEQQQQQQHHTETKKAAGIVLDDCRFHQCVRLAKYESERAITFVPPDGVFQLMSYRITEGISLPFKIFPLLQERSDTRLECMVLLKALFSKSLAAINVEVVIPCPPTLCGLQLLHVGAGKAAHDPAQEAVIWKLRRFPGCAEHLLRYDIHLSPPQTAVSKKEGGLGWTAKMPVQPARWKRPPLNLRFTLHMFTPSGVCIRYLKITEKSNYKTVKWIRYVTKAGSYQHRL